MPDTSISSKSKAVAASSDPFKALSDRLDRVFGEFHFPGFGPSLLASPRFTSLASNFDFKEPKVNVGETDKAFEVTAELPGLDEKNIEVVVADGVLTIKGEKKEEKEQKDEKKNYHLIERSYGSFRRSFVLPDNVRDDGVTADFAKGVLTVVIPKKKTSERPRSEKKIAIKSH